MSLQFRLLTRSKNDLSVPFDALRMNGNVPFFSLDSRANSVSNASVFHRLNATTFLPQDRVARTLETTAGHSGNMLARTYRASAPCQTEALTLGGRHRGN
jgi:hypothetical protein